MTDDVYPPHPGHDHHMKPLVAVAVTEAVKLALIDSVLWPGPHPTDRWLNQEHAGATWHSGTDQEKAAAYWDVHNIPAESLATMDPTALAQNVCVRLLSPGNWTVGGVYAGNASPAEVLDASVHRPDEDPLGDIKMAFGLRDDEDEP